MAIKAKAKISGDVTQVKVLMRHPMETGQRKDKKTGKNIPAHYIDTVTCKWNGELVMQVYWGPAISKNPYMSFKVKGPAAGDTLALAWADNQGGSDTGKVIVK
ncbi:MAG: thiosulfate oxidation carrier complex protein SoxZ [Arenicellales bacterium WSBS_2016_MAG_OTU3]